MTHTNDARSAGVKATLLEYASLRAEVVMQEIGMTLEGQRSDQVTEEMTAWADKIVLFSVPEEHTPTFLKRNGKVEIWDIEDLGHTKEGETIALDRQVRDEVQKRVDKLVGRGGE